VNLHNIVSALDIYIQSVESTCMGGNYILGRLPLAWLISRSYWQNVCSLYLLVCQSSFLLWACNYAVSRSSSAPNQTL